MSKTTNSNSTSKKIQAAQARAASSNSEPTPSEENTTSAEVADEANNTATVAAEAPKFKSWRIKNFADLAHVDPWHLDKVLHFMSNLIRNARLKKLQLIEFTFYEPGRISYVMKDLETGEYIREPKNAEDPLA
jgi:hypothetical protein